MAKLYISACVVSVSVPVGHCAKEKKEIKKNTGTSKKDFIVGFNKGKILLTIY